MGHRRLTNQLDRIRNALPAFQEIELSTLHLILADNSFKEGEQYCAEDLELFEDLVGIESLLVAQCAELHRLGAYRRLGVEIGLGVLEIGGDAVNEKRHVIQEALGGEDLLCRKRDPSLYPLEPTLHELPPCLTQPVGKQRRQFQRIIRLNRFNSPH